MIPQSLQLEIGRKYTLDFLTAKTDLSYIGMDKGNSNGRKHVFARPFSVGYLVALINEGSLTILDERNIRLQLSGVDRFKLKPRPGVDGRSWRKDLFDHIESA